ncbi:MAG TPA: DUF3450 family protein [Verrucomicrobiales bacterium]|nr:DUF3450 family protein [Verrucomicrobiales bacterium]
MFPHRYLRPLWLFLAVMVTHEVVAQDSALPGAVEVQSKLEQWVKTRQLISEEASDWATEKATLAQLNEVRKRESEQLDEFVKAAGQRVNEIAGKRAAFVKEESDLKAWRSELEKRLTELASQLAPLLPRFPPPLREKIEESLLRIESPDPDAPLQNRTRDVLLVLQSYLDFQNTFTVYSDVREIEGARREIDILYLGMTQAWYVDAEGKHSGYGYPTDTGWQWAEDATIAARVRAAIEIQTKRATAAFVELPISKANPNAQPEEKK